MNGGMNEWWNDTDGGGDQTYLERNLSQCRFLSTTNPTLFGLVVNTVNTVRTVMTYVILGWPFHMQKWFGKGDGLKI